MMYFKDKDRRVTIRLSETLYQALLQEYNHTFNNISGYSFSDFIRLILFKALERNNNNENKTIH